MRTAEIWGELINSTIKCWTRQGERGHYPPDALERAVAEVMAADDLENDVDAVMAAIRRQELPPQIWATMGHWRMHL